MKRNNKKDEGIDIHSDIEKDAVGILWYKPGFVRDPSVWTKTPREKAVLKKMKRSCKKPFLSSWGYKKMSIPCYGKLIIQLYQSPFNDSHCTFSVKCGQSQIPEIIARYDYLGDDKGNVRWYKWNGKQYSRHELPQYYW